MGKNVALAALLVLALPWAAQASSIKVVNVGGVISGDIHGMTRSESTIRSNGVLTAAAELTINTGFGLFKDSADPGRGDTTITRSSTPEPGTLSLFGTGLLGLAGYIRYRWSST